MLYQLNNSTSCRRIYRDNWNFVGGLSVNNLYLAGKPCFQNNKYIRLANRLCGKYPHFFFIAEIQLPIQTLILSSSTDFQTSKYRENGCLLPRIKTMPICILNYTVRLVTRVLCKPTHFFFHSFIATMSNSLQTTSKYNK